MKASASYLELLQIKEEVVQVVQGDCVLAGKSTAARVRVRWNACLHVRALCLSTWNKAVIVNLRFCMVQLHEHQTSQAVYPAAQCSNNWNVLFLLLIHLFEVVSVSASQKITAAIC